MPLLLRKAGLKGSGYAPGAAASLGCLCPCCSARRGLRARATPRGQLLRLAARAPVAPQGGAKGSGCARGQLLRLAARAPIAPQSGA
ncbi:hypothetical protein Q0V21_23980 [Paenibacillus sp. 11B]|nr:hypothetical protein [Paenibacillus sp. 11B]